MEWAPRRRFRDRAQVYVNDRIDSRTPLHGHPRTATFVDRPLLLERGPAVRARRLPLAAAAGEPRRLPFPREESAVQTPAWQQGVLDPQGPVADAQRTILSNASAIMVAVVVPVIVLALAFAWWFRAGNRWARRDPDWAYSGAIELTVWAIPTLVVLFLGGIAWIGSHALAPARPLAGGAAPLDVQVVSLDWKWLFIYPALGVASVDRLVVPAGTPLRLQLTSASVMNSFFVPQLGSQIYTMAGMTTTLHLRADRPGRYAGLSAQFSGDGFSDMRFDCDALPPAGFEQWLAGVRATPAVLDAPRYAELARPGAAASATAFGRVAPGLFQGILAGAAPARAPRALQ